MMSKIISRSFLGGALGGLASMIMPLNDLMTIFSGRYNLTHFLSVVISGTLTGIIAGGLVCLVVGKLVLPGLED